MKKVNLFNSLFATVVALALLLASGGAVLAANDNQSDTCSKYLETISGLSNLPCTPGNLSAILVFVPVEPPARYPCADLLAVYYNPPNSNCVPQVNSAIIPLK